MLSGGYLLQRSYFSSTSGNRVVMNVRPQLVHVLSALLFCKSEHLLPGCPAHRQCRSRSCSFGLLRYEEMMDAGSNKYLAMRCLRGNSIAIK